MAFYDDMDFSEWVDVYKKLVYWELEIENTEDKSMSEILDNQKEEANKNFASFIKSNYEDWVTDPNSDHPVLSHQLMKKKVFPQLEDGVPVFFIVIDNLRYDQWEILEPAMADMFNMVEDDFYYSILPTTTAYARNAIFSGMMPIEMEKRHPDLWVGDDQDEGKNNNEEEFLKRNLDKNRLNIKSSYHKIIHASHGKSLVDSTANLMKNDLNVVVFNFVDMLSHARTDMQMIRELAPDEAAYRSLTLSWFMHSSLLDFMKKISESNVKVIVTTDHGTIRVKRPFKIIGDRSTNTNLRYKQGKNLGYDGKDVFEIRKPENVQLPRHNVSTSFAIAQEDYFFAYPNNFNYYVNHYKDTFQHGGISMEEMILPVVTLRPKKYD
jgi:hypothetical protein